MFRSTKTYGHERGLSCCFRQWKAQSNCRLIHGYALSFKLTFQSAELDVTNWVTDFGSLKSLKGILDDNFDHTMLVAEDDPQRSVFELLHAKGLAKVIIVPATGCEATAHMVFEVTQQWLKDAGYAPRVDLVSVEVAEHAANSAIYLNPKFFNSP